MIEVDANDDDGAEAIAALTPITKWTTVPEGKVELDIFQVVDVLTGFVIQPEGVDEEIHVHNPFAHD
jgi:hypothetical protein